MKKRNWTARLLALAALVAAVVAVIVVAAGSDVHSGSDHATGRHARAHREARRTKPRPKAKKYVVRSGDTLISIAHRAGITLAELRALNPEVDPQTLIAGEVLKLRR